MNDPQPAISLEELEQRIVRRISQFERMLGAVSHSLGATMFPSMPSQEEVKDNRQWRRAVFATEALVDHVRNEKGALDFARNSVDGQLEAMPKEQWFGWVWPTLQSAVEGSRSVTLEIKGDDPISPSFTREVLTLLLAVDEVARCKQSTNVVIDIASKSVALTLPKDSGTLKDQFENWLAGRTASPGTQTTVRLRP